MAKITREQYAKYDAQAPGDWSFDLQRYLVWSEKQVRKIIPLHDGKLMEATIYHMERLEKHSNGYCTYAGNYNIKLCVNVLWPSTVSGVYAVGMGRDMILADGPFPRRDYKAICKAAETVTDEQLLDLAGLTTDDVEKETT